MAYSLPRFMSREDWEALSPDNLHWFEQAGKWVKFFPADGSNWNWQELWAAINFSHPDNVFKRGQETLYVYGKRIHSDYRKMYGVT